MTDDQKFRYTCLVIFFVLIVGLAWGLFLYHDTTPTVQLIMDAFKRWFCL